jgi:hypothetical protein
MVDYAGNLYVNSAGGAKVDEKPPRPDFTQGLRLNGTGQYLRIGDDPYLNFGSVIQLRSVRAYHFWVRFDEFTNNAHIFDFGDGPGKNNVFFGILGKGDPDAAGEALRPTGCETTVPTGPSGAQWCPELTPQDLLATSAGNVDDFSCPKPEVLARKLEPSTTKQEVVLAKNPKYATLLYEVWDNSMRKMQIKIPRGIQVKKWTQIVITATTNDAMRPDIEIWANGEKIGQELAGFLPQNRMTTHNYIGKSNWTNDDSLYDIRDELFQGALFDFRMYSAPLSKDRITRMYEWGQGMLGLI